MTMDKSLKVARGKVRSRSVLTRPERIERLQASDRWREGDSPFGLSKVRVFKLSIKKKKKKKEEETASDATAAGAAAAAEPAKKETKKKEATKKK